MSIFLLALTVLGLPHAIFAGGACEILRSELVMNAPAAEGWPTRGTECRPGLCPRRFFTNDSGTLGAFATEVIAYIPGTGIGTDWMTGQLFNDPTVALGRPTVDTTGNGFEIDPTEVVPVVPVSPAFRSFELVTIGNGGSLTLKFEQPVLDHPNHPYGIDFIVFGNAMQTGNRSWSNRSPHAVSVLGTVFAEPGLVSVSQDGETWFTYTNGPYADTFAPTLGRMYQPDSPDVSLGEWNEWWGEPTDPTWPLDPAITASNLIGRTVAEVARIYGRSAGGTGFDLSVLDLPIDPETGMKWMQYIRIESPSTPGVTPEIDAVAAVRPVSDYELWKLEQFDWEQRADPEISGDDATGLIPGVENRLVYAMGLDVVDRELKLDFDPLSGEIVFSFPRRVDQDVLNLHVEYSVDLSIWQTVDFESQVSVAQQGDGTEIVTYSITPDSNFAAVRIKGVTP